MTKRKMPAHTVLPNGMWRFIKGSGTRKKLHASRKRGLARKRVGAARMQNILLNMGRKYRRSHYGGNGMARRHSRHHRSSGFGGGKKIFGLGTKGIIGSFGLLGVVGAALFSDQIAAMVPVNIPAKNYATAFAIGGPAGLAAKVVKDTMLNGNASNTLW